MFTELKGGIAGALTGYALLGLPGAIGGPVVGVVCGGIVRRVNDRVGPLFDIIKNCGRVSDCFLKLVMSGLASKFTHDFVLPNTLNQHRCIAGPFSDIHCGSSSAMVLSSATVTVLLWSSTAVSVIKIFLPPKRSPKPLPPPTFTERITRVTTDTLFYRILPAAWSGGCYYALGQAAVLTGFIAASGPLIGLATVSGIYWLVVGVPKEEPPKKK